MTGVTTRCGRCVEWEVPYMADETDRATSPLNCRTAPVGCRDARTVAVRAEKGVLVWPMSGSTPS